MACNLTATQTAACTTGIGKVHDPIQLLQIIAELACELASVPAPIGINTLNQLDSEVLASSYTFTTFQPSANALVLLAFTMQSTNSITSVVGNGLTWTLVSSQAFFAATRVLYVYRGLSGSPTNSTLVVTLSGLNTVNGILGTVVQFTGVSTAGTNGSGAIIQSAAQSSSSLTLASPMSSSGLNAIIGFSGNGTSPNDCFPKSSWFQDADMSQTAASNIGLAISHKLATTDNSYVSGGAGAAGSIVLEVGS